MLQALGIFLKIGAQGGITTQPLIHLHHFPELSVLEAQEDWLLSSGVKCTRPSEHRDNKSSYNILFLEQMKIIPADHISWAFRASSPSVTMS